MVTVALAASRSCAAGLPNNSERPMTSASKPAISPSVSLSRIITPVRRAGNQLGAAAEQEARVGGRQRVHVLGGIERVEHRLLADLPRQRQLHEYSVYGFVGVEGADPRQNLRFAGAGRQMVVHGVEAERFGGLVLVADIDFAGGIVADQNGRQSRNQTVLGLEPRGFLGDARPQGRRMKPCRR